MKRYAVFASNDYSCSYGLGDFIVSFNTVEEAIAKTEELAESDDFMWAAWEDLEEYE